VANSDNPEELSSVSKEALVALVLELRRQLHVLGTQVQELKAQLAKNSTNSSKPPSSDGLSKPKRRTKSLREAGKRKSGGQKGHGGQTLRQVQQPDAVLEHAPGTHCDACGEPLSLEVGHKRQVFDMLEKQYEVIEHRVMRARCRCGKEHSGAFPVEVAAPVQYGPRVSAAAVYLTQHQMVPLQRSGQVLGELFGLSMSQATVQAAIEQAHELVKPTVQEIGQALTRQAVAHADESGLRVAKKLHWLHVLCTGSLVWMKRHTKRGKEAFDALELLKVFAGVLVHDGWQAYQDLPCAHALCNAHHLRELIFLAEEGKQGWAQEMIELLRRACHEVNQAEQGVLAPQRLQELQGEYARIIAAGQREHPRMEPVPGKRGRPKQSPAANLLARLEKYAQDVWRFASDAQVPFTNNAAEQVVRMPKVKQKIAGCFRTDSGADAFCAIRSYLTTMGRQGRNAFECLTLAFQGQTPLPHLN
jgi:transposase